MSQTGTPPSSSALNDRITAAIDEFREELIAVSRDIHSHPELNYEEWHAAGVLADSLEARGFEVQRSVASILPWLLGFALRKCCGCTRPPGA